MTTVGRPPKLDAAAVAELYRLADAGLSPMELGVRFHVSLPTVYAYMKKKPRTPEKGDGAVSVAQMAQDTPDAEGIGTKEVA